MADVYDAVVIGGGHNGLVTGFYLARAGMRCVVLERRDILGGACNTEEFAPGYRASTGAYVFRCCGSRSGATCGWSAEASCVDPPARR